MLFSYNQWLASFFKHTPHSRICFPYLKWSDPKYCCRDTISVTYNKLPFSLRLPLATLFLFSSLLTCASTLAFCLSPHTSFITSPNLLPSVPGLPCQNASCRWLQWEADFTPWKVLYSSCPELQICEHFSILSASW